MITDHDGTLATVRGAYGARVEEYVAAVGGIDHVAEADLALVTRWALGIEGPVLDIGCGPGQWTHHLAGLGIDVEGVDPVPEFVAHATATYPGNRYRVGRAENLGAADGALGGVLAWYSLIHTAPERIGDALAEFARCIRPGGGLALGFFTGDAQSPFDHAVTTAYYWPVDLLAAEVAAAGFAVTHTESRTDRPDRAHGAILAVRGTSDEQHCDHANTADRSDRRRHGAAAHQSHDHDGGFASRHTGGEDHPMTDQQLLWDDEAARTYDTAGEGWFADDVLKPCVQVLSELAGDGRVVEFAVGTGRVAIPLSDAGVAVAGIELSHAMIDRLREKASEERIPVVQGDMTTARAGADFSLAFLVCNTIANLLSQGEQVECFRNAARHLAPGGRFVVELGATASRAGSGPRRHRRGE